MATWTKSELATAVLQNLGVLAAGETAASEDSNSVQASIDSVHAQLRSKGLVPFATSAIPEWAQLPLRDYVAFDVANVFGLGPQRRAELAQGKQIAEIELRKQTNTMQPSGVPVASCFY